MVPWPLSIAKQAGIPIFGNPFDPNWIVLRGKQGKPDEFDGLSNLCWVENGAWRFVSITAATRPGTHYLQNPMNSNGTAVVQPGRHRLSHTLGLHQQKTPGLVQRGKVIVRRDNDKDLILDPADMTWDDAQGVNHHECENPKYLAGCIGSPKVQLTVFLDAYRYIIEQRKRLGLAAQPLISLSLVEV